MIALISDIHGNIEALSAVMTDIDARGGAEAIYCLGDIVGYGPEPEACVDVVQRRCSLHLMGNHDQALLNRPVGFNPVAKQAIEWARARMEPGIHSMPRKQERWQYLHSLQERHEDGEYLFVHASPRDPVLEYVLPSDATYQPDKVADLFRRMKRICFVGHTHVPGIMTPEPAFLTPEEVGHEYTYPRGQKVIINIGSVGQPRDGDPRSCYVEFDENGVRYHRVEYDHTRTFRKIQRTRGLNEHSGMRLAEGK